MKTKSSWCLLIDVPACLLMIPAIVSGVVFTLLEVGYTFGRHHTIQWFMASYKGGAR